MFKNVLFDLDGTLLETDAVNNAAYEYALAVFNIPCVRGLYGRIR